jgi:hypothetical protein
MIAHGREIRMRTQVEILQDIAETHKQYFKYLADHTAFMQILIKLRQLEQELIEVVGNKHDAYHLEHISYMAAMDEFMSTPRKTKN